VTDVSTDPHAKELAVKLDGLPLALATAGAYLGQVSTSLKEYLRYYTESWLKLQKTSPKLLSYEDRTLYTTWNMSLEHIKSENESAAQLLRLWAYLDNQDVWYELLAASKTDGPEWFSDVVQDELSFNHVIRLLCDHGLVEPSDGPGGLSRGYGMHSCVHDWTKFVLGGQVDTKLERIVLSCVVASVPSEEDPEFWAIQRRLLPHASKWVEAVENDVDVLSDNDEGYLHDLDSLGTLLEDQGKMKEAEVVYHRALDGKEKSLGSEHTSTLRTVNNLGILFRKQGKLKEAEVMYQRALDGQEKSLGPEHTSTLATVNNLGILYWKQGKLKEAEAMYQRTLDGYKKSLGPEHPSTLETVNNLGVLYEKQGRLKEAEAMYQRALDGFRKSHGPEHPSTLISINNLGVLYREQGKLKEAGAMYQRALEGCEESLGPKHPSTLKVVHNLGILYEQQCKYEKAEGLMRRALEGYEKLSGLEHSDTLDALERLKELYRLQGKIDAADALVSHVRSVGGIE
jgi:tetratricopeptide (TPR) repeat protein